MINSNFGCWLDHVSEEFINLRNYLVSCLQGRIVSKLDIWKIESDSSQQKFEIQSQNNLCLPCWSLLSDNGNNLREICESGLVMNDEKGIILFTGTFQDEIIYSDREMDCIYVYVDACIGQSFVADDSSSTIPDGYDSLYLLQNKLDRNNDGEFSLHEYQNAATFDARNPLKYRHTYCIKDSSRVNPKYIFRFSLTNELIEQGSLIPNNLHAASHLHDSSSSSSSSSYAFVDPVTFKPLTLRDKVSTSFSSSQKILSIDDAFDQALQESNHMDPVMMNRVNWINQQLDLLDEKSRSINLNYADIYESITDVAEKAVKDLQSMTKNRLESLLSIEIELRRQLEQFQWMDSVKGKHLDNLMKSLKDDKIPPAAKVLGKVEFLNAWRKYMVSRNILSRAKFNERNVTSSFSFLSDVQLYADLRILPVAEQSHIASSNPRASLIGSTGTYYPEAGYSSASAINVAGGFVDAAHSSGYFTACPRPHQDILSASFHAVFKDNEVSDAIDKLSQPNQSKYHYPLPIFLNSHAMFGSKSFTDENRVSSTSDSSKTDPKKLFVSRMNDVMFPDSHLRHENVDVAMSEGINGSAAPSSTAAGTWGSLDQPNTSSDMGQTDHNHNQHNSSISTNGNLNPSYNNQGSMILSNFQSIGAGESKEAATVAVPLINIKSLLPEDMAQFASRYKQHSLKNAADRKFKMFKLKNVLGYQKSIEALCKSSVLSAEEAKVVFFNLPFFSSPPSCRLLYSTAGLKEKSLDDIYMKTVSHRGASLLILSANNNTFGVYLSHPLVLTGSWTGSPACFLFNLTADLRFPFHSRVPPISNAVGGSVGFLVDRECLRIGNQDLIITVAPVTAVEGSVGFYGTSELEGCYGLGLPIGGLEASCLLAGKNSFHIDFLEVWAISN